MRDTREMQSYCNNGTVGAEDRHVATIATERVQNDFAVVRC
jgi:hypothetical protein